MNFATTFMGLLRVKTIFVRLYPDPDLAGGLVIFLNTSNHPLKAILVNKALAHWAYHKYNNNSHNHLF
jgi:hypothetical protein